MVVMCANTTYSSEFVIPIIAIPDCDLQFSSNSVPMSAISKWIEVSVCSDHRYQTKLLNGTSSGQTHIPLTIIVSAYKVLLGK